MYPQLPTELKLAIDGAIATITLNRPHKLNTLTPEMGQTLFVLADAINRDDAVRAVILTGEGKKAFSAGSDITVLDRYGNNWELRNRIDYAYAIRKIRKPVIAMIRGYCIGGGLELALMSDVRIATPDAQFAAGEVKLGLNAGAGNTQLLPRMLGYGNASKMLFTGDLVDATEAHRIGLVQEVVSDSELESFTRSFAARTAANAPIAVQLIKHLVRMADSTPVDVGLSMENDLFAYCFKTQDRAEGMAAFLEKRTPKFSGQ